MADNAPGDVGSRKAAVGLRSEALEALRAPKLALRPELPNLARLRPELPSLARLRPELLGRPPVGPPPVRRPAPPRRPNDGQLDIEPATPPSAPRTNPFGELPYRSPGDRILAEDFNRLSQALEQIAEARRISSAVFGTRFGDARSRLEGQGYTIRRVVSVFGTALQDLNEESATERLVISASLVALGAPEVDVVLSERVEGRRFVPDLRGRSYAEAHEAIRNLLADVPIPPSPGPVPTLVGSTLATERDRY